MINEPLVWQFGYGMAMHASIDKALSGSMHMRRELTDLHKTNWSAWKVISGLFTLAASNITTHNFHCTVITC